MTSTTETIVTTPRRKVKKVFGPPPPDNELGILEFSGRYDVLLQPEPVQKETAHG